MNAKPPTPQAISALLRKAGYARSEVTPGRVRWDGTRVRSAKRSAGYRVIKGNHGEVRVSYSGGDVVSPNASAKQRDALLADYARAICAAGWQATVSEPDEWAPRVIVAASDPGATVTIKER